MKSKYNTVRFTALLIISLFLGTVASAQEKQNRKSPPTTVTGKIGDANVTVHYGSPSVKGRKIWGGLVPYGEVWRSGADEATTFETDKNIMVDGQRLPKGKYSFLTIPRKNEWTIIFNNVADQWGAFKYESAKDALRATVKPATSTALQEHLTYTLSEKGMVLSWENIEIFIPMSAPNK